MINMNQYITVGAYAEIHRMTEESVITEIRKGDLIGQLYRGSWFVKDEAAYEGDIKPQSKAGRIGFMLGFSAFFFWATFFGNIAEYSFRHITLLDAITSAELMSSNGLPGGEIGVGAAMAIIFGISVVCGIFTNFIFWLATK